MQELSHGQWASVSQQFSLAPRSLFFDNGASSLASILRPLLLLRAEFPRDLDFELLLFLLVFLQFLLLLLHHRRLARARRFEHREGGDVSLEEVRGDVEGEEADREGDPERAGLQLVGNNWLREGGRQRGVEVGGDVGEEVGEVEEGGEEGSREAEQSEGAGVVAAGQHREQETQNGEDELDEEEEHVEAAGEAEGPVLAEVGDVVEDDLAEEEGGAGGEEPHHRSDFKILKTGLHVKENNSGLCDGQHGPPRQGRSASRSEQDAPPLQRRPPPQAARPRE